MVSTSPMVSVKVLANFMMTWNFISNWCHTLYSLQVYWTKENINSEQFCVCHIILSVIPIPWPSNDCVSFPFSTTVVPSNIRIINGYITVEPAHEPSQQHRQHPILNSTAVATVPSATLLLSGMASLFWSLLWPSWPPAHTILTRTQFF